MYAYEIDSNGYIVDNYLIDGDVPIPDGSITVQLPQPMPFHRPKWNGTEWGEGKPQEEIDFEQLLNSLQPTQQKLNAADLEIKILTLLLEMEVI